MRESYHTPLHQFDMADSLLPLFLGELCNRPEQTTFSRSDKMFFSKRDGYTPSHFCKLCARVGIGTMSFAIR